MNYKSNDKKKLQALTIRLTSEEKEMFQRLAISKNMTVSEMLRTLVEQELNNLEKN